jgi:glyceraldehyde 3-phosphate dehydrogenase
VVKVGINGFGRIGRAVVREAFRRGDVEIVAVNDLMDIDMAAYLLQYDSAHLSFCKEVRVEDGCLAVDGKRVLYFNEKKIENIPFKNLDVVIESTGRFLNSALVKSHLKGSKKVIISAPATDDTSTYVFGINHKNYKGEKIISNASCTTNCLAPIAYLLDREFGILKGMMTTIHSYTIDQNLLDSDHKKDIRRSRAAAVNLVPTTTGAAKAIYKVLPNLKGKFDGRSVRVPVEDVSMMDLTLLLDSKAKVSEINEIFKKAAQGELEGILDVDENFRVSKDFLSSTYSCVVAADLTQVVDKNLIKVFSWYDNEYGYANRLLDMAKFISKGV